MIVPLKKSSNVIVTKLAKRNLKADKRRNYLLIIIIALATCLIMTISLFFSFTQKKSLNDAVGSYQAAFSELDPDTINALQNDERLKVGLSYLLSVINYNDLSVLVRTIDENLLQLGKYPDINGKLPSELNEIAVTQPFLEKVNLALGIGDNLTLNLGDGDQQFIICGILPVQDANYSIYVSDNLVKKKISNPLYLAYINIVDTEEWSEEAIQNEILKIANEYRLDQQQITFSTHYFSLIQQRSSQYIMIILVVSIVVAAACTLVIYSLFYVSITQKTNEYGKLRTLGTTRKQISKVVVCEGRYLAYLGIPIGIILGEIIGYMLVPEGANIKTAIMIAAVVGVYIYICIMLAVLKPAKIASKVTPIEALRYISDDKDSSLCSKKLHRTLSVSRLALLNFRTNKKKAILTICSLGISGILLMGSSAYFHSIDPIKMARQNFPYGEIGIELGTFGSKAYKSNQYLQLQENNLLTSDIVQKIKNIEGVNGLREYKGTVISLNIPTGYEESLLVTAIAKDDQKLLEEYIIAGTADVQELFENDGIIIKDNSYWETLFGWKVKVGEMVSINLPNGDTYPAKIMGIIDSDMPYNGSNDFFIPSALLSDLIPINNLNYQVIVDVDDDRIDSVKEEIKKLFSNTASVYIITLNQWIEAYKDALENYRVPVFILIIFIGVFGFINLLNTLISNMHVRKHEFAILQAVGLSNKQLSKTLLIEGLIYTIGTMILSVTIGSLVGYIVCKVFSAMSVFGEVNYQFPVLEMIVYLIIILIVQLYFSAVAIKQVKKQTLVERIQSI